MVVDGDGFGGSGFGQGKASAVAALAVKDVGFSPWGEPPFPVHFEVAAKKNRTLGGSMQVKRTPKTYDVCIIGSGASGGTAAKVLSRRRPECRAARGRPAVGSGERLQRARLALRFAASRRRVSEGGRGRAWKTNFSRPTALGRSKANLTFPLPAQSFAGFVRASSADAPITGGASPCAWPRWISRSARTTAWATTGLSATKTSRLTTTKSSPTSECSGRRKIFPALPTEFSCRRPSRAAPKPSSRRPATI